MPRITVHRSSPIIESARVKQVGGMFDVPPAAKSEQSWEFDFELPADWNVGLIVGPSGSGKSTIARECFPGKVVEDWPWPADQSILDGFAPEMSIKDVVGLLSSVGFSSPPAWLRPFHVLSNGEQFRVNLARTLAEMPEVAVVDEFTSVVDRQVARVGSAAVAKAVRRRGQKFVAVSCHYDIIDWLDPDWVFQPHTGNLERRSLQGRPTVELEIFKADRSAWKLFSSHHYLSTSIFSAAACFVAVLDGEPVGFASYVHFPHPKTRDIKMAHRLVVLPDYQGLGIGGKLNEWVGEYLAERGFRYHTVSAHPALIAYMARSPRWKLVGRGGGGIKQKGKSLGRRGRKGGDEPGYTRELINTKQSRPRQYATFSFAYLPVARTVAAASA